MPTGFLASSGLPPPSRRGKVGVGVGLRWESTLHNLHFMLNLLREIREAILAGTFPALKEEFLSNYEIVPHEARQRNREARLRRVQR